MSRKFRPMRSERRQDRATALVLTVSIFSVGLIHGGFPPPADAADPAGRDSGERESGERESGDQSSPNGSDAATEDWDSVPPATSLEAIRAQFPVKAEGDELRAETLFSDASAGDVDADGVSRRLDALGSAEFAARERAAGELLELGPALLPLLRKRAEQSPDPEIRMRARELVEQVARSDLETRVSSFMEGGDVGFEGWSVARQIFGDSPTSREMFVRLRESHPAVVTSLAGGPRDRTEALEEAMLKVQQGIFVERVLPTREDMISLLLLANDPNVTLSKPVETLILQSLRFPSARELLGDPHFGGVCSELFAGYVERTSLTTRGEVLWFAMELEVKETLPVAIETLSEANQPMALVTALQTIAKFGSPKQIPDVRKLFDNETSITERGLTADDQIRTTVGAAALATAAILLGERMTEIGFPSSAEHPRFGFLPDEIGLDNEPDEVRASIRERIEEKIAAAETD